MNLVLCYFSLLYLGCFMQTMMVVSTHINQTTYQCVRPTLELWNDELRNLFAQPRPLGCSQVETNWVYVDNSSLRIDQSAAALHGPINCHYIPIRRGRNDFEVLRGAKIKSVRDKFRLTSDTFMVNCHAADGASYHNVHSAVVPTPQIIERSERLSRNLLESAARLNILIFGFDSVSRLTWMRNLPRSYDFIVNELQSTVFGGYNVVGDGTAQALLPILTGHTEQELPEARRGFPGATTVDGHPWIWNELKRVGYVTQYGEDAPNVDTFTYRMLGFTEQPVDHYTRTYYMEAHRQYHRHRAYCSGSVPRHQVMLHSTRQLLEAYPAPTTLKFSFLFYIEYSHDYNNLLRWADDDLRDHLNYLLTSGHLNRSMLVLLSDHGARFQAARASEQGKFEERMPFLAVRVPVWFSKRYPDAAANLRSNADKLTTPFDLHETFKDILDMERPGHDLRQSRRPRAYSLFRRIPEDRTCADAHIAPHWCVCLDWQRVSTDTVEVRQAADTVVAMVNNMTSSHPGLCARLQLDDVTSAVRYVTSGDMLRFKSSSDLHGRVGDFSDEMQSNEVLYQVTLKTTPNGASYEATVRYERHSGQYFVNSDHISRINRYSTQPRCIADQLPHLRPFCYCDSS